MNKTVVDKEFSELRFDKYLRKIYPEMTLSEIFQMIKNGEVLINGKKAKKDYRLSVGDSIVFFIKPSEGSQTTYSGKPISDFEERVLYEDEYIMVFDKPSGIPVHGGSKWSYSLEDLLKEKRENIYLVHRLDKETSGILLVAKRRDMAKLLSEQLRNHEIKRYYLALVKGKIDRQGKITINIEKDGTKMVVSDGRKGKTALTTYKLIKRVDESSLIELKLETGRTHQIRIHMSSSGYPVAGDWKYGDREFNIYMKKRGLKRVFLHSFRLEFIHPDTKEKINIESSLPYDLNNLLNKLSTA